MKDQIFRIYNKVSEFANWNQSFIMDNIKEMSDEELTKAIKYENEIDDMRNEFIDSSSKRLTKDSNSKSELLFIDIIKHLEHIGDFSLNISQALEQIKK